MKLRPFSAIVAKDIKLHLGNRRALIITIAIPIAIASLFGSIFGGQSGKARAGRVPVQMADLDQSKLSADIITNLAQDELLAVSIVDENTARQSVRRGKVAVAVIFPRNFGEDASRGFFRPGTKPVLTILHDPSRNIEAGMVQGILLQHVMQAVSKNVFSGGTGRDYTREALKNIDQINGLSPESERLLRNMLTSVDQWQEHTGTDSALNTFGPAAGGLAMPFKVQDEQTAGMAGAESRGYNGYAHSFGGMSMQFVLMAAIEWGLGILLERQRGLWRRLRAAPVSRGTLLAGRMTSSGIIAFSILAICWGFSMAVFNVQVSGSWVGFIGCNVALAIFAASLGLFIAALGRTPEATRGIAILVILILVMLGGAWAPSFLFPDWLREITLLFPTRWAMDGFDAMTWRGLGLRSAFAPIGMLLGSAAICGLLALRCFRWEED